MAVLALDIGGSGGKFFSGHLDGSRINLMEILRFDNAPILRNGHLYWDFQAILVELKAGLRIAANTGFTSFGVDSFCNDYGLLDRSGLLLNPFIYMYRDKRTIGSLEKMEQIFPSRDLYDRTGCQRARFNTLVQLFSHINSEDKNQLDSAEHLLFVPDLINHYLTGQRSSEYSISSVSQLFNRNLNSWDAEIIEAFQLKSSIFPKVVQPSTILGISRSEITKELGIPPFHVSTVAHHDTASAVAAVPSIDPNFVYISSGTWSLMGTETDEMITSDLAYQLNFANEGGVGGKNRFLKNIMGLWIIQECQRDFLDKGLQISFEEMDSLSLQTKPFQSIINPDDPIFFEPGNMLDKIRTYCQLHDQNVPVTPAEVNLCIKQSLALAYRRVFHLIESLTGKNYPHIHIIGGGANSKLLNQLTASAIGLPVYTGPKEAAVFGNICAQLIASGDIPGWKEARKMVRASIKIEEILPINQPGWDDAYATYLSLINR